MSQQREFKLSGDINLKDLGLVEQKNVKELNSVGLIKRYIHKKYVGIISDRKAKRCDQ